MTKRLTCLLALLIMGAAASVAPTAQQAGRDAPAAAATGTAAISGTVVLNEANAPPVRRALVSVAMRTTAMNSTRQTTTDDQGRFVFRNLPAGTYTAHVTKAGLVPAAFGETRPYGVGTPISLAEGEKLSLPFKLLRGAVITGTLLDNGRPVIQTTVNATPVRIVNGARLPGTSRFNSAQTDDRGVYRIYGLPPGDYVISASPRLAANTEIRPVTEAEIQWATQQLQQSAPAGAAAAPAPSSGGSVEAPRPAQPLAYSPVYYPGTSDSAAAAIVTIAAGQERTGIDFNVTYVPTSRVEGTVVNDDGSSPTGVQLNMVPAIESDPFLSGSPMMLDMMLMMTRPTVVNGRFSLAGVRPGRYTVFARAPAPGAQAGAPGAGRGGTAPMTMWAMADVAVEGQDVTGLELRLQPGLTVHGRLTFDPASGPPPADLSRLSLRLTPAPTAGVSVSVNPPVPAVNPDGTFHFEGISPGRYVVNATLPGGPPPWILRSARVGDVDAADNGVDIRPGQDTPELVLTFTTRMAELSGRLLDGAGRPSSALSIILFSVDPQHWNQRTRRIRPPTRAGTDGAFRFTNLLPGEYYLAALSDFEQADIFKPEFLEQVGAAAMKITIGEGEKKVQDIRIAGK